LDPSGGGGGGGGNLFSTWLGIVGFVGVLWTLFACIVGCCIYSVAIKKQRQWSEDEYEEHLSAENPLRQEQQNYEAAHDASNYTNFIEYCNICNDSTAWVQECGETATMTYEILSISSTHRSAENNEMVMVRDLRFRNSKPACKLGKTRNRRNVETFPIISYGSGNRYIKMVDEPKQENPNNNIWKVQVLDNTNVDAGNHFTYQASVHPKAHCCHPKMPLHCCPTPVNYLSSECSEIPNSADRGVTAEWLRHFTFDSPHSELIRHKCTKYVVLKVIEEQTRQYGCRYSELKEMRGFVGRADYVVSHAWNGNATYPLFEEPNCFWEKLVNSVSAHSNKIEARDGYLPKYWIDIFAMNQHPVNRNVSINHLEAVIKDTKGTLLVLASDDISDPNNFNPIAPTRAWCLFEFHSTLKLNKTLDIGLDPKDELSFQRQLMHEGGSNAFENKVIKNIDVESARCSRASNEKMIKDTIRNGVGFDSVNDSVKNGFREWLAEAGKNALDRLGKPGKGEKLAEEYMNSMTSKEQVLLKCLSKNNYVGEIVMILGTALGFILTIVSTYITISPDEWAPVVFFKALTFLLVWTAPFVVFYQEIRKKQHHYLVGAAGGQFAANPNGNCCGLIALRSSGGISFFLWLVVAVVVLIRLSDEFVIYAQASDSSHRLNSNCVCKNTWTDGSCSGQTYHGCSNGCSVFLNEGADVKYCWVNKTADLIKNCDVTNWMYCDEHSSEQETGTFPQSAASGWAVLSATLFVEGLFFLLFVQEGFLNDFRRDALSYAMLQRDVGLLLLQMKNHQEALVFLENSLNLLNRVSTTLWHKHGMQALLKVEVEATRLIVNRIDINTVNDNDNGPHIALEKIAYYKIGCFRSCLNRCLYTEHGLTSSQWEREKLYIAAVARAASSDAASVHDVHNLLISALRAGFNQPNAHKHPFLIDKYQWPLDELIYDNNFDEDGGETKQRIGEDNNRTDSLQQPLTPTTLNRKTRRLKSSRLSIAASIFNLWLKENNVGLRIGTIISILVCFMWKSVIRYTDFGLLCGVNLGLWTVLLFALSLHAMCSGGCRCGDSDIAMMYLHPCSSKKQREKERILLEKNQGFAKKNLLRFIVIVILFLFISYFQNASMDPKSTEYCVFNVNP
jgi:hypothetical protein